jgi:hypothetical protein
LCAGAFVLLAASAASATEICVKCSGPDASYACVVNTSSNGTIDTVTKLFCITALAKAGPHASCTVDRSTTAPCQGQRKEFAIPAVLDVGSDEPQQHDAAAPPGSAAPVAGSATPGAPQASPAAAAAGSGAGDAAHNPSNDQSLAPAHEAATEPPPKTVQEMLEKSSKSAGDGIADTQKSAGDAAKSAGSALAKAGTAVGDAAKNSWKCLSSFFSNC